MYVCLWSISVGTKFHAPSSNGSLYIAIKPEAKENIYSASMLFYALQESILIWIAHFFKNYYPKLLQNPK
jgi:hypothetical protein